MAKDAVQVNKKGLPIKEYPKSIRVGEGKESYKVIVKNKAEEDEALAGEGKKKKAGWDK